MSENCPNSMTEDKKEKPHFICEINYARNQDWRTDFTLGQKGVQPHGHMALSGATIWYLRDEQGNEIIKDGKVVLSEDKETFKKLLLL